MHSYCNSDYNNHVCRVLFSTKGKENYKQHIKLHLLVVTMNDFNSGVLQPAW